MDEKDGILLRKEFRLRGKQRREKQRRREHLRPVFIFDACSEVIPFDYNLTRAQHETRVREYTKISPNLRYDVNSGCIEFETVADLEQHLVFLAETRYPGVMFYNGHFGDAHFLQDLQTKSGATDYDETFEFHDGHWRASFRYTYRVAKKPGKHWIRHDGFEYGYTQRVGYYSVRLVAGAFGLSKRQCREEASYELLYQFRTFFEDTIIHDFEQQGVFIDDPIDDIRCLFTHDSNEPKQESVVYEYQMDNGDIVESEKADNTILTEDHPMVETSNPTDSMSLIPIVTSEPGYDLSGFTNRNINLDPIILNIDVKNVAGDVVKFYRFPESILIYDKISPVGALVRNTLFAEFQKFILTFYCTSQRFNKGMIIISVMQNEYQGGLYLGLSAAFSRQHVIIDLSKSSTAIMEITPNYFNPLVRTHLSDGLTKSIRPQDMFTVFVQTLSPFSTMTGNPTTLDITAFVRVEGAKFHGMTYETQFSITVQDFVETGISVLSLWAGNPVPLARQLFRPFQDQITQWGKTKLLNLDKPLRLEVLRYVPQPQMHFPNAKGLCGASPLRFNPTAATSYYGIDVPIDEPKSWYDIARMPTIFGNATISTADTVGKEVLRIVVDPTYRHSSESAQILTPTGIEMAMSYFMFYHGVMTFTVVIPKTLFHEVTLEASVELEQIGSNLVAGSSTYMKVMDFGDTEKYEFNVPFIYDTYAKRSSIGFGAPFSGYSDDNKLSNPIVAIEPRCWFVLRVVNPLRCPSTVPNSVDVLVLWNAGENFTMWGIKPTAHSYPYSLTDTNNFPQDGYTTRPTSSSTINKWGEIKFNVIRDKSNVETALAKFAEYKALPTTRLRRKMPYANWRKSEMASKWLKAHDLKESADKLKELWTAGQSLSVRDLGEDDDDSEEETTTTLPTIQVVTRKPTSSTSRPTVRTTQATMTPLEEEALNSYQLYSSPDGMYEFDESVPKWVKSFPKGELKWVENEFHYFSDREGGPKKWVTTSLLPGWTYDRINKVWINMTMRKYGDELPRRFETQMDSGDTSANLSLGNVAMPCMSSDFQTSFADILKRPCLIVSNATTLPVYRVSKKDSDNSGNLGFFIPVCPPSFNMGRQSAGVPNSIWAETLSFHPTVGVVNMFRKYRGEQRYTYVIKKVNGEYPSVAYVYYLPHTGVRILGNHQLTGVPSRNFPYYGMGFHMDMIIPSINPTLTVEVPYETENPWSWTWETSPNSNYSWRDKARTNNGHVVIACDDPCRFDVFWSAGDNFQLSGFMGIPTIRMDQKGNTIGEENQPRIHPVKADGKVDITDWETQGFLGNTLKTSILSASNTVTETARTVGGSVTEMVRLATGYSTPIQHALETFESTCHNVDDIIEKTSTKFGDIHQTILKMIEQKLNEIKDHIGLSNHLASLIFDMFLDLVVAWHSVSWFSVGVAIFRLLAKAFAAQVQIEILPYVTKFVGIMEEKVTQSFEDADFSVIIGLLVSFVGTITGCVLDVNKVKKSLGKIVLEKMTSSSGVVYINHVLRLTMTVFSTCKKIFEKAILKKTDPNDVLEMLTSRSEELDAFCRDAQEITSVANSDFLKLPHYRQRVVRVYFQALTIQKMLIMLPSNKVSPVLNALCAKVVRFAEDHWDMLSACPVRREPFIIFVEGEPGIGKSHTSEVILEHMLQEIGWTVPANGLAYYRTAGQKWWSGYYNQPGIIYDEFLNLNHMDECIRIIAELFALKSPALFIPEQADISRKENHGNPLAVIFNCNNAFPGDIGDFARHSDAIMRRRDIVVRYELKDEYRNVDLSDPKLGLTDDCEHLQVRWYRNPRDPSSLTAPVEFKEYIKFLRNRFKIFHSRESRKVEVRTERFVRNMAPGLRVTDPFELYYNRNYVGKKLETADDSPFMSLKESVLLLTETIKAHQQESNIPEEPDMMYWPEANRVRVGSFQDEVNHIHGEIYENQNNEVNSYRCNGCGSEDNHFGAICDNGHFMCAFACFGNMPNIVLPWMGCFWCEGNLKLANRKVIYNHFAKDYDENMKVLQTSLVDWIRRQVDYAQKQAAGIPFTYDMEQECEESLRRFVTYSIYQIRHENRKEVVRRWTRPCKQFLEKVFHSKTEKKECQHEKARTRDVHTQDGDIYYMDESGTPTPLSESLCGSVCSINTIDSLGSFYEEVVGRCEGQLVEVRNKIYQKYAIKDDAESFIRRILRASCSWRGLQVLSGIIIVAGSIYGITRYFAPKEETQLYDPDRAKQKRAARMQRVKMLKRPWNVVRKESQQNMTTEADDFRNVMLKKARLNMISIWLKRDGGTTMIHAFGIREHWIMMPKHSYKYLCANPGTTLFAPSIDHSRMVEFEFLPENGVPVEDYDICFYRMPATCPMFKNVAKYFAKESDYDDGLQSAATLLAHPRDKDDCPRLIEIKVRGWENNTKIRDSAGGERLYNSEAVVTNYSERGICGAILLQDSKRMFRGMHYAGSSNKYGFEGEGLVSIVTQEMLDYYLDSDIVDREEIEMDDDLTKSKVSFPVEVQIQYEGVAKEGKSPHVSTKSKLVPSSIFNHQDLAVPIAPAILSRYDPRYQYDVDPLEAGVMKHGVLTKNFPQALIKRVKDELWDGLFCGMEPLYSQPRKLTIKQAVVGFDHDNYPPINLKKSAGYPWILSTKTLKEDYIEINRVGEKSQWTVKVDTRLLNRLKECEAMLDNGIVPAFVYVDSLKDEKRKVEKLSKFGGTRIFCNGPMEGIILFRQYTMHFVAAFIKNRSEMFHAVGINPTSREWSQMTRRLLEKGDQWFTIDYTNFGPGFNLLVGEACYDIIIEWCAQRCDIDRVKLKALFKTCIQSLHICRNLFYTQMCGSPSGAPLTTPHNTMVNIFYLYAAWIELTEHLNILNTYDEFIENVYIVTFGDDGLGSVTPKYRDIYNAVTISQFFQKYDIVSSDATKSGIIQPYTHWTESSFLKRGFKPHDIRIDEVLSPLSELSVKSTTQWVWRSNDIKESTRVNCEAAFLQAHGHGREYFNAFKRMVNEALVMVGIKPISLSWENIDTKFYTEGLDILY